MIAQIYSAYSGTFTASIATTRPEAAASSFFANATAHEDWSAKVRAALKEHKHVGVTSLAYPVAKRIWTYFPTNSAGASYYAFRELKPAGTLRDVDAEFMLEVTRLRYDFNLLLLPPCVLATEPYGDAHERAVEKAVYDLFAALSIPNTHIPGDNAILPGEGTYINLICELGPATVRTGFEIPAP